MERHLDLDTLSDELGRLGAYGMAQVSPEHSPWLEACGVAVQTDTAGCLLATSRWLAAALPARDPLDLLRKTLIRDATYRLHLDLVMASVLQAVGSTARWARLEELLRDSCRTFSPRFVALLEWMMQRTGKPAPILEPEDWSRLDPASDADLAENFAAWDERLWGFAGAASALFPLLHDLYCPLLTQPVVPVGLNEEAEGRMLADLTTCARGCSGVQLHSDYSRGLARALVASGLPVRLVNDGSGDKAVLVGAVECVGDRSAEESGEAYVDAMSVVAKSSRFCVREDGEPYGDVWALEKGMPIEAFVSLNPTEATWPESETDSVPVGAQLPRAELLRSLSSSRESVEALRTLCAHAFFGFYVQLLLLEALDRELGQESLILAPERRMVVEDIEASTKVLYRPHASENLFAPRRPTTDLGELDVALDTLAKGAGLQRVHAPYRLAGGVWSLGLRLMRSVELVRARSDRWALSEHVVDRLHSGGLMTDVIRRGKGFRERLHEILTEMWSKRLAVQEASHG